MSAPTATNVSFGKPNKAGSVYTAPLGTPIPADEAATLDEAFVGLGYVSEDGVSNNYERETEDIKAWGGDIVLTTETGRTDEWSLALLESLNIDVLKTIYGDSNVTLDQATGKIAIRVNSTQQPNRIWVIDMSLAGGAKKRVILPNAAISGLEEITYKDDDAISYGLTLKALPGADGDTHKEYIGAAA